MTSQTYLRTPQLALLRSSRTPSPVSNSVVIKILPESGIITSEEFFVRDGRQEIPLMGCGVIHPGGALGA